MDLSTRQGRREQGQRIQQAVERAGLSIEELAGRIGCSRALIYQYLSGTTLAQPDRLQQIAGECGVSLAYFYADDATLTPSPAPSTPEDAVLREREARIAAPPEDVAARLADSLRALNELADAQESPPDYRALASTCERILSLSAQLGDRETQARAQRRLGNALLSIADNARAVEALRRAIDLARSIGDTYAETHARQSLGKAFVALGRANEARDQFARVAASPDFDARWKGALSLGSVHEMRGEYQQAMQRFDEAASLLEEGASNGQISARGAEIGLLYVNGNRANVYLDEGDFRGARPLTEKCLVDAESLGNVDQHLEAHLNLASCDLPTGRWPSAWRSLTTLVHLARFVGDQGRETLGRAWQGLFLAAAGDHDAAISNGKDALALALSQGDRRAELYAQLALADAYTGTAFRDSEARYHASQALAIATALRHDRDEIECRLRFARLSVQTGELADLREAANRALSLAQKLGARHLESLARVWLAEALFREASADAASGTNSTAQAVQEAETGLRMAQEMELVEPRWRAAFILARIALEADPPRQEAGEQHLRDALATLESLRAALRDTGIPDTLLENEDCVAVYSLFAQWLQRSGRAQEVEAFLEQTGWPPLAARVLAAPEAAAD